MPYPDEKRWYYTRDDAFNLILVRFRLTQQKMKKIDIFFHSLSFLTLKNHFFLSMIFSGHFRLPEVIETPTKPQFQPLSRPSKRVWANILSAAAVIERLDWILEKKTRHCEFLTNPE